MRVRKRPSDQGKGRDDKHLTGASTVEQKTQKHNRSFFLFIDYEIGFEETTNLFSLFHLLRKFDT